MSKKNKNQEEVAVEVETETSVDNTPEQTEPAKEEVAVEVEKKSCGSVEECISMASEIAAKLPAHAGKSARQHGTDIAAAIRDMLK